MAEKDTSAENLMDVTRRDFLKFSAGAAAIGGGWALGFDPSVALAYEDNANGLGTNAYTIKQTTCPYCSASCGQRVVVDNASGEVIDIYGDFESPMNAGGLCAKGAGTFQLVTNPRRIGAWDTPHPVNSVFEADTATYPNGVAYKRTGNGGWSPMDLQTALGEVATSLVTIRSQDTTTWPNASVGWPNIYNNSKSVAFLGSSHMNNEGNYIYRKLIANFGTSNVEHQARI